MGAILATWTVDAVSPFNAQLPRIALPMDASLYFRLTDQIDGAASLEELAAIEVEIERTQPHAMELRALERRLNRRERALEARPVL